ncbi:MAG: hypothetical protein ACKVX9_00235 [Blastocatellia bacterium]
MKSGNLGFIMTETIDSVTVARDIEIGNVRTIGIDRIHRMFQDEQEYLLTDHPERLPLRSLGQSPRRNRRS